jgi:hypothetical protein
MRPIPLPARTSKYWVAAALIVAVIVLPGCAAHQFRQVSCQQSRQSIFVLEAQAVPSATLIPCMGRLPLGWSYGGSDVGSGLVSFWFDSDRAGPHAIEVTMTRTCDTAGASEVYLKAPPPGLHRYEAPAERHPSGTVNYFVFPGGCVTYRFGFTRRSWPDLYADADRALGFTPRLLYVNSLHEDSGLTLCGAKAPPCAG